MDPNGQVWQILANYIYILASYIFSSAKLFVAIEANRNTTAPFPITNQTLSNFPNKLKIKSIESPHLDEENDAFRESSAPGMAMVKAKLFFGYTNLHETFMNPKNEGMSHLDP